MNSYPSKKPKFGETVIVSTSKDDRLHICKYLIVSSLFGKKERFVSTDGKHIKDVIKWSYLNG